MLLDDRRQRSAARLILPGGATSQSSLSGNRSFTYLIGGHKSESAVIIMAISYSSLHAPDTRLIAKLTSDSFSSCLCLGQLPGLAEPRSAAARGGRKSPHRTGSAGAAARVPSTAARVYRAKLATISASSSNAAMCHYHSSEASNKPIGHDHFYLNDSGGQYVNGTTDARARWHGVRSTRSSACTTPPC